MIRPLTWEKGQHAGVGTGLLWVLRRVPGLQDLVEVEKFPVPPVDEVLTPSFGLHVNHKPLGEKQSHETALVCVQNFAVVLLYFCLTYKVINEAFLLLNISNGGADWDIMRQLIKVT